MNDPLIEHCQAAVINLEDAALVLVRQIQGHKKLLALATTPPLPGLAETAAPAAESAPCTACRCGRCTAECPSAEEVNEIMRRQAAETAAPKRRAPYSCCIHWDHANAPADSAACTACGSVECVDNCPGPAIPAAMSPAQLDDALCAAVQRATQGQADVLLLDAILCKHLYAIHRHHGFTGSPQAFLAAIRRALNEQGA